MAVKPWLGAIKAPTNPGPPVPDIQPETDLELRWVHGYNALNTRNAVHYTAVSDESDDVSIVYPAATLAVKLTPKKRIGATEGGSGYQLTPKDYEQHYNEDHKDDIVSMAVDPSGKYAASGAIGKRPQIIVFETDTLRTVSVLCGFHKVAVSALAFSRKGKLLASIGEDEKHSLAIYNWETGTLIASAKGEKQKVYSISFNYAGTRIAQCGHNHVRFWQLNGRNLTPMKGLMKDKGKIQPFTSICHCGDEQSIHFIVGGALGQLYKFVDRECIGTIVDKTLKIDPSEDDGKQISKKSIGGRRGKSRSKSRFRKPNSLKRRAHEGSISSLVYAKGWGFNSTDSVVISGGRKGWVKIWKVSHIVEAKDSYPIVPLVKLQPPDMEHCPTGAMMLQVRSLSISKPLTFANGEGEFQRLLIGTRAAQIWEYCLPKEGSSRECDWNKQHGYFSISPFQCSSAELRLRQVNQSGQDRRRFYCPLVEGHWKDEVWGLAMHPFRPEIYCTTGDDKSLRVWHIENQELLGDRVLKGMARAVCMSPDASMIAVGFGGSVGCGKDKMDGWVYIFDGDTKDSDFSELEEAFTMHHAKGWISDIKWSPDGSTIAVGSHDNKIYIYDVFPAASYLKGEGESDAMNASEEKTYQSDGLQSKPVARSEDKSIRLRGICKGHTSYITHMDFSTDSRWLQSTCGAYELLFWDVRSPNPGQAYVKQKPMRIRQQPNATAMRDVEWSTWTCTLGWPVQGIWPKCADGTDINSIHVSNIDTSSDKKGPRTIITADDSGLLKMFRYPCTAKGAPYAVESGHSSHVTNVRWSCDNKWVVSTGGNDRCVFQWKKLRDEEPEGGIPHTESSEEGHEDLDLFDPMDMAALMGGDESQAVKTWTGQIAAPSRPSSSTPLEPDISVELEWIFGYRAQDCRDNLRFSASGDILYHSAAVGIALTDTSDPDTDVEGSLGRQVNPYKQRFFCGHDDDILCLATSPDGRYVATGQIQSSKSKRSKPCAQIWDAESCRWICTLGGVHQRCVSSVCFSKDGRYIATVGGDNYHSVALWATRSGQWEDGKLVTKTRGDSGNTLFLTFASGKGNFDFATGGKGHIRFWKISGHTMKSRKGILSKKAIKSKIANPFITAISISPVSSSESSCFLVGMYSGHIYVFIENRLERVLPAHGKGGCGALHAQASKVNETRDNMAFFVSGGADGDVILWGCTGAKTFEDWSFDQLEKFNLQSSVSPRPKNYKIQSVCWDAAQGVSSGNGLILVGTKGSEIYQLPVTRSNKIEKRDGSVKEVVSCHCADEVWGLDPHPHMSDIIATSGDDATVRIWKTSEDDHQPIAVGKLKTMSRAVAWDGNGSWLVVGLGGRLGKRNIRSRHRRSKGRKRRNKSPTRNGDDDGEEEFDGSFMIFNTSSISSESQRSAAGDYVDLKPRRSGPTRLPHPRKGNDNLWISDVKFTNDNTYIAFATHAQRVFIYDSRPLQTGLLSDEARNAPPLECVWQCCGSSSAITHLDWSLASSGGYYLQTNDLSYEILRYFVKAESPKKDMESNDIPKCERITNLNQVRNINWHTYTVPLGWGVQGIWPSGADGSDINAVDRSPSKSLVATADDFGDVKIFNYPCTTAGASCKVKTGHSSHVMNVRFSCDEKSLFTVGGNDRSIFKWKVEKDN